MRQERRSFSTYGKLVEVKIVIALAKTEKILIFFLAVLNLEPFLMTTWQINSQQQNYKSRSKRIF